MKNILLFVLQLPLLNQEVKGLIDELWDLNEALDVLGRPNE
jgi:hypothetical protein